ncbi:Integral membrane protein [Zalerion maritima]|uniref:Integral membrane protein n=1 Tax=Zalerion maritima TaxID=339359 RepID=A0AAD5RYT7_9PEZI|nr:Integral membrane protein [Zalerion maritima]
MRIFGSKKKDGEEEAAAAAASSSEAPDEHTRLLPNRLDSEARFLNADDPAVSPYNLWNVRLARFLTIIFTVVTFAWWILQLISAFVTPPTVHTRGAAFYSFGYATVSLLLLLATLLFFAVPAKSVRLLCIIMSVLLLLDIIVSLAVERVRHEERWVGIVSTAWTFLMSLWAVLVDRIVKWGKAEEEERLTGRPETRRTLGEWSEVAASSIIVLILDVTVFLMTLNLILRSIDTGLGAPGNRYWVDGDKYQIHVYCHGNKTDASGTELPTVLFEGGEEPVENGLWQFADAAVENGTISRYCFADRPGFAWSDNAPSPLTAGMASDALSEALVEAGEKGPWVLVSAGVGTVYTRIFSSRHGREVDGLLMIDPLHEDLLDRVASSRRGFFLWLRGVISPLGISRVSGAIFKGRSRGDRVWGRSITSDGRYLLAKLQENLVADSLSKREVISSKRIQNQKTPLIVISSGEKIKSDGAWQEKQRDLSHLTQNLIHWDIANHAPHEVWKVLEGRALIEKRLKQLVHGN